MPSLIFICTANICRSPMAMAIFLNRVQQQDESWRVESAGTWAYEGDPASEKVVQVLAGRGLDISNHRSRLVSHDILSDFDLILTMEQGQMEALKVEFPDLAGRVYMLSEMIGMKFDIKDPIGGPLYEFEETANEFERIFDEGDQTIYELLRKPSPSE